MAITWITVDRSLTTQNMIRQTDPVMANKMMNNSAKLNGISALVVLDMLFTGEQVSQFAFVYLPLASLPGHNAAKNAEAKIAQREREKENFKNSVLGLGFHSIFNRILKGIVGQVDKGVPVKEGFDIFELRNAKNGSETWFSYEGKVVGFYKHSSEKGLQLELNIPDEYQGMGIGSFIFQAGARTTNATKFTGTWGKSTIYETGSSVNLQIYQAALAKGLTPEEAAWQTWSGAQAKANGFTKVSVKEIENGVEASFTK